MDVNAGFVFAILFLAVGPLRVIPVFYACTRTADRAYRIRAALIATLVSAAIIAAVAFFGAGTLESWHVSAAALEITIGILLLRSTFTSIAHLESLMSFSPERPDATRPSNVSAASLAFSPIAVPNLVSATAVVTIALFLSLASNDTAVRHQIYAVLAVLLVLDFAGMLLAGVILRLVRMPTLVVLGWIFAALQAALAVELMLNGLKLAGFISR